MQRTKPSVTIGIPAFNEEANILHLIADLGKQKSTSFLLEKIIVSSDGSTDCTVSLLLASHNRKIVVVDNKKRHGQAFSQNQIIRRTTSDVLVLLNADIAIYDTQFLEKLVRPVIDKRADLTSSALELTKPTTVIESILNESMYLKYTIFDSINHGDNVYTCHGGARAFSKRLYRNFSFQSSVGEDAYSYLYAKFNSYTYRYVRGAQAYVKYADNLSDHRKQSIRFFESRKLLTKKFGKEYIKQNYKISLIHILKKGTGKFIKKPLHIMLYGLFVIEMKIESLFPHKINETWEISISSKKIK